MNKVIAKEYVDKNYIHKGVIREILKDVCMVNNIPVKNTSKKQVYKAMQIISDLVDMDKIYWRIEKWNIGL